MQYPPVCIYGLLLGATTYIDMTMLEVIFLMDSHKLCSYDFKITSPLTKGMLNTP